MVGCGLFVTGTDTGVGKTAVSSAIARVLRRQGVRVGVYKPVSSGDSQVEGDADRLWEAAGRPLSLKAVCPQRFAAPISPPRSARAEGREVDASLLRAGFEVWRRWGELVVVEGAGALFSPLADGVLNADLARDLGLPLVIVDAPRLGTIGRMLSTYKAAQAAGLRVAALVLSHVTPAAGPLDDPASPASIARDSACDLTALVAPAPVTILPHNADGVVPELDWQAGARG